MFSAKFQLTCNTPPMKMWRPVHIGESVNEWSLVPADDQREWPDLSYFTSEHFLDGLERERFWNGCFEIIWMFGEFPLLLLYPFPLSPVSCLSLPVCTIYFCRLKGRPCNVCFKYHVNFFLKVKLPLPAPKWWILFSFCLRVKRVGSFVFISLHGHFLPPILQPSACLMPEISGSGAVTSTGSDTILEAFVCSFP